MFTFVYREGSIIVTYRVHWNTKVRADSSTTPPPEDLLTASTLKANLNEYLNKNNRMINIYHIADDKIVTRPVLDICQINKNGCEYGCKFDETSLDFICTCPPGKIIDMTNPKICMSFFENPETQSESHEGTEVNSTIAPTSNESTETKVKSAEDVKVQIESEHSMEQPVLWQEPHHVMPETTTDSETEVSFSHIIGNPTVHPNEHKTREHELESSKNNNEPGLIALPASETGKDLHSTVEPTAEPEPATEPNLQPTFEPQPNSEKSDTEMSNKNEQQFEIKSELESDSKLEPEPESKSEPEMESKTESESKSEPEPEPNSEPETDQKSEPPLVTEPKPEPEPTAEPEPEPNSKLAEPKPEPEPESKSESEPESKSELEPELKSEPEPESKSEPQPEPKSEPEPKFKYEPELESKSESEMQSKSGPMSVREPEITIEQESRLTTESEPKSSVDMETTTLGSAHYSIIPTLISPDEPQLTVQPITETESTSDFQTTQKPQSFQETIHNIINNIQDGEHEIHSTIMSDSKSEEESNEDKSVMFNNGPKLEFKPDDDMEKTTTAVSISGPNIISDSSYEIKPDIISILSNNRQSSDQDSNKTNEVFTTTESNDWLEANNPTIIKSSSTESNDSISNAYANILSNNVNKIMQQSEQRSFKSFDDEDLMFETTTSLMLNNTSDDDSTTEYNSSLDKSTPSTLDTLQKIEVDNKTTSVSQNEDMFENVNTLRMVELTTASTTTEISETRNSLFGIKNLGPIEYGDHNTDKGKQANSEDEKEGESGSMIKSILQEANSLETNQTEPIETTTPEMETEFSLNKHYQNSKEEKLIDILEPKPTAISNETSTEHEPEEGIDITFDSINMLYNRSSKSIENLPKNNTVTTSAQETVTSLNEGSTTTESDWLSEPVTEMNYDIMNKIGNRDTTESSASKLDDVIHNGLAKDDFEPEYLNNMGSNNKQDDEPLYSMVHDYDNEDSRYKRVNKEVSNEKTPILITTTNLVPTLSVQMETTTVSEYIYKMSEERSKLPQIDLMLNETNTNNPSSSSPAVTAAPAPVWEESVMENSLGVKDMSKEVESTSQVGDLMESNSRVGIDEIQLPSITTLSPITTTQVNENIENPNVTEIVSSDMTNGDIHNTTQTNNFNVTIYEISSQNDTNSSVTKSPTAQSAEYDDHEPEMNPFLPEVENNKILVKKLQEGHDLEPINLNETQNENTEEHLLTSTERQAMNKDTSNVPLTTEIKELQNVIVTPEQSSLHEHANETSLENISDATNGKMDSDIKLRTKENQKVPISTFLLDTDDLDTTKEMSTTTLSSNQFDNQSAATTSIPAVPLNDGEFLKVVPITEEETELPTEDEGEKNESFNDITESDLPKSDKRTLDATKFDSANVNEA